jgi:hypothetical protein
VRFEVYQEDSNGCEVLDVVWRKGTRLIRGSSDGELRQQSSQLSKQLTRQSLTSKLSRPVDLRVELSGAKARAEDLGGFRRNVGHSKPDLK